jgi:hypothetical protein
MRPALRYLGLFLVAYVSLQLMGTFLYGNTPQLDAHLNKRQQKLILLKRKCDHQPQQLSIQYLNYCVANKYGGVRIQQLLQTKISISAVTAPPNDDLGVQPRSPSKRFSKTGTACTVTSDEECKMPSEESSWGCCSKDKRRCLDWARQDFCEGSHRYAPFVWQFCADTCEEMKQTR